MRSRRSSIFQPTLRLSRLAGLGPEPFDELDRMAYFALLALEHRLLKRELGGALSFERGIVAGIDPRISTFEVNHARETTRSRNSRS